ncbi:JNK-interacting protein 3 isoform X4 [Dendroctonus ponderosae]|uniref:JNK-interacting protein 3 isoform X4 n=1 Tax=Dendroctonus ponderosae TaxID=77166 RepID=UPI00203517CE|nr:JNK-interacting protein 3 isoform X4 [Dendroctonus ponderosae]
MPAGSINEFCFQFPQQPSHSGSSMNMSIGAEVVYGTHEESHVVMSEKVQALAGSIYQEFERMISQYDEDVVKTLLPLLVNVLECLDSAYQQNQEQDVEVELLKEDNEQLVTQYEREKGARKTAEQKLLEYEDAAEGERKELTSRLESLESIVRMLELKHKNSMEHANRLEEREGELKKEYAKLHERYTELFKTHVDYMERTKLLHSGQQLVNERVEAGRLNSNRLNMGRSSGPISFGFASLEDAENVDSIPSSPISSTHSSPSLHNEMDSLSRKPVLKVERAQETDTINLENKSVVTSPVSPTSHPNSSGGGRLHTKREQRSGNTLYQELSFQDVDGDEDPTDITGGWVHPGEYASSVNDNFYGMGKEVENLIMENNELMATKNALNVVKDDLIVKVDELTGEIDMLREEILSLNVSRTKLRERTTELEEELRKVKEAHEAKQDGDEEEDVPMAERKRFTRLEMSRVLMEKNQYKENLMELQEAVRWAQIIKASREPSLDKHSNRSIWSFFSNLFSGGDRVQRSMMGPDFRYQAATNRVSPGLRSLARIQDRSDVEMGSEKFAIRKAMERREQYRQVRAHVKKDDGRLHAYGWSLPGKVVATETTGKQSNSVPVPVPVYCRPLAETKANMRIWCAAGVNSMGGYTKDGGLMVGGSVFYSDEPQIPESKSENQIEDLEKELNDCREGALLETRLTSMVWIVTTTQHASMVTVIDANNPAELLTSFGVCSAHVLCIASVPGASPSDYIDTPIEIPIEAHEDNPESNEATNGEKEKEKENNAHPSKVTETPEGRAKAVQDGGVGTNTLRTQEANQEAALLGKISFVENDQTAVKTTNKASCSVSDNDSKTDDNVAQGNPDKVLEENDAIENPKDPNQNPTHGYKSPTLNLETMSTVLATMWLADTDGNVYIHSSVANWHRRLQTVKLGDSVISIVHVNGRVVVALANGQLAVFKRHSNGEWDLSQYHIVQIGLPHQSVRKLAVVGDKVWCGYRNKIHVLQPRELKIIHTLEAHPRRESPVRDMAWLGEGVWVSIRLDSTLRLYHAHTYQHLQDVDIEPYVSKMLGTGKLGFSFVRITSLLISSNRLWIGTSNGVIISVPLTDSCNCSSGSIISRGSSMSGSAIRFPRVAFPEHFVPYCTMAHAQLSFHGHRDNVKFFVAVPGKGGISSASSPSEAMSASVTSLESPTKQPPTSMLVISGGEGYVDFRVEDDCEPRDGASHLLIWQVINIEPGNPMG